MDIFHLRNFNDNFADGGLLLLNKDRNVPIKLYKHIFYSTDFKKIIRHFLQIQSNFNLNNIF